MNQIRGELKRTRIAGNTLLLPMIALLFALVQVQAQVAPAPGWHELPNTRLRSVCPPNNFGNTQYDFSGHCWAVTGAWNGGVFDSARNRLIIWGGGHNDYYGNEIYSLDLNSLTMSRLTDPGLPLADRSTDSYSACTDAIAHGTQPNSRHTYDGIEYMPNHDRMFVFGGAQACRPGAFNDGTWTFSFSTNTWEKREPAGFRPREGIASTAYDPNTGKVYLHDTYDLYAYDFSTDSYEKLTDDYLYIGYHSTAAIDPVRKKFVTVGWNSHEKAGRVYVFDISHDSDYARQTLDTFGGESVINSAYPGLAYDPVAEKLVAWSGGNTVYSLDLDTGVWTPSTFSGGPGAQIDTGTHGRWQYSPTSGVFVVYNSVDSNAFILRTSAATALSSAAQSLQPGQSIRFATYGLIAAASAEGSNFLQWGNTGAWDPLRNRAVWIGKRDGTHPYHRLEYDEATNSWDSSAGLHPDLTSGQPGHGYDGVALDPATGDIYFRPYAAYSSKRVYRWIRSSNTWQALPAISGRVDIAEAIEWWPGRGLVFSDMFGVRIWDGSSWSTIIGDGPLNNVIGYHSFGEYQPNANVYVFGGGNADSRRLYRLDSGNTLTQLGQAPIGLGNSATSQGIMVFDPGSSDFIAWDQAATWYSFDPVSDTWLKLARCGSDGSTPCDGAPGLSNSISIAIPVPKYDVIMFLGYGNDDVWLYRPPGQTHTAPQDPPAVTGLTVQAVSSAQINLAWSGSEAARYDIERCDGVGCSSFAVVATTANTTYSDTGLSAETSYTYRVRARDALGNVGPYSSIATAATSAAKHIYPGTNVFSAAAMQLKPGDTLVVHEGTYLETVRMSIDVRATEESPAVIRAADGEDRPLITRPQSASVQNTINIEGASHLTIRGLEITGNGGDGINMNTNPEHITIEDNVIHDVDVGINFRSTMHDIVVRRNHIYNTGIDGGTGEGMYVGCNYNNCQVTDSLIEGNWIHDCLPGTTQGDGIEIKWGSVRNIVRDNVIYNMDYPGIFVYGGPGSDVNVVEGNVIWNCLEGIYAPSDAIIRNNIIMSSGTGLSLYGHAQVDRMENVHAVSNTVFDCDEGIYVRWGGSNMVLANNAVYCPGKTAVSSGSGISGTVKANFLNGKTDVAIDNDRYFDGGSAAEAFADAANMNLWPKPGSVLIGAADTVYLPAADFNGIPRTAPSDIGAYETEGLADNHGWAIAAGFKHVNSTCVHPADNNPCNGIIDMLELSAYIASWKSGSAGMARMMEAIRIWKG